MNLRNLEIWKMQSRLNNYFKRKKLLLEEYSFYVNLYGAFVHPHRKDIVTKKELYNMSDNDFYILVE